MQIHEFYILGYHTYSCSLFILSAFYICTLMHLTSNNWHQTYVATCFMHTYCHSTPVNDLWNAIKDICRECLNLVPSKESFTRYNQPWINSTVKSLSCKKQRCYNRAHVMGFTEDWLKYHRIKRES